jgi:hypothetical protein
MVTMRCALENCGLMFQEAFVTYCNNVKVQYWNITMNMVVLIGWCLAWEGWLKIFIIEDEGAKP